MELRQIVAAPFVIDRSWDDTWDAVNNAREIADGVLAFYAYENDAGSGDRSTASMLTDEVVQRLADLTGRCIGAFHRVQREYARLFVSGNVVRRALVGFNASEIALDTIRQCLRAAAGTLFVNLNSELHCAATTGLTEDGMRRLDPADHRCRYSLTPILGDSEDRGFTVYLGRHPGTVLRKNDVPDSTEVVEKYGVSESGHIIPSNKVTEAVELSESEHRRFLGASSKGKAGSNAQGVVRLNRGPTHMPFIREDERLLNAAFEVVEPLVAAEASHIAADVKPGAWEDAEDMLEDLPSRKRAQAARRVACKRLRYHWPVLCGWNVPFLDSILHDVLVALDWLRPVRAEVRLVNGEDGATEALAYFRDHSWMAREPLDEEAEEAIDRRRCENAWKAVDREEMVLQESSGGLFERRSERESGTIVYAPFYGLQRETRIRGVLGIELGAAVDRIVRQRERLGGIGFGLAKLSLLGVDNGHVTRQVVSPTLGSESCALTACCDGRNGASVVLSWLEADDPGVAGHHNYRVMRLYVGPCLVGRVGVQIKCDGVMPHCDADVAKLLCRVVNTIGQMWHLRCAINGGKVVGVRCMEGRKEDGVFFVKMALGESPSELKSRLQEITAWCTGAIWGGNALGAPAQAEAEAPVK